MNAPLLVDAIPTLAEELKTMLAKSGVSDVVDEVDELRIVDRCRCGEDSCAQFYTATPPDGAWGPGHENVMLHPKNGLLILDLLNRKIVCVEILDNRKIKRQLDAILPLKKS